MLIWFNYTLQLKSPSHFGRALEKIQIWINTLSRVGTYPPLGDFPTEGTLPVYKIARSFVSVRNFSGSHLNRYAGLYFPVVQGDQLGRRLLDKNAFDFWRVPDYESLDTIFCSCITHLKLHLYLLYSPNWWGEIMDVPNGYSLQQLMDLRIGSNYYVVSGKTCRWSDGGKMNSRMVCASISMIQTVKQPGRNGPAQMVTIKPLQDLVWELPLIHKKKRLHGHPFFFPDLGDKLLGNNRRHWSWKHFPFGFCQVE